MSVHRPQPVLSLPWPHHLLPSLPFALVPALGFSLPSIQVFPEFYLRAEISLKPISLLFKTLSPDI